MSQTLRFSPFSLILIFLSLLVAPVSLFAEEAEAPGGLEIHGLLQGQFLTSLAEQDPFLGLDEGESTFRLRRGEIALSGQFVPEISFVLMFDPTKVLEPTSRTIQMENPEDPSNPMVVEINESGGALSVLQDAIITFSSIPNVDISIGQGLTPLTYEGLFPSGEMLFAERSFLGSTFGDQRDIGVWAHHRFDLFSYQVGIYNGQGGNQLDQNKEKDVIGRLQVFPMDGLSIGASGHRTLAGDSDQTLTVAGADVALDLGGLSALAEFYWGKRTSGGEDSVEVSSLGAYGALGYLLSTPYGQWQPVARFDWFSPNTDVDELDKIQITAGLNFLFHERGKLILNYVFTQSQVPDPSGGDAEDLHSQLLLFEAQTNF